MRRLHLAPWSARGSRWSSTVPAAPQSPALRVAVVGLGAIGSVVFAKLAQLATTADARALRSVTGVARPRQLSEWLGNDQRRPARLRLTASDADPSGSVDVAFEPAGDGAAAVGAPSVTVRALEGAELPEGERFDAVLLAVKAYDSENAIRELQRAQGLFKRDALCVLLQNGLGEGLDGRYKSGWRFMNGVTFIGGRVKAFGDVVTSGAESGTTFLAPVDEGSEEVSSRANALAAVLRAAGLRCEVMAAGEMQATLWRKLIVNAGINPIASLLDGPNKSVGACEWSQRCVSMVVREALAVARAEQVPLHSSEQELVDEVLRVARDTGDNTCSMLADLRRGSRTEIDAISGRIVALGRRHGVATPANELLLSLVKAREGMRGRTRPQPS